MNSASKDYDGKNKYIRITDINDNTRQLNLDVLTSPEGDLHEKYLVKKGDILFARTGASVGKSYLHNNENPDIFFCRLLNPVYN